MGFSTWPARRSSEGHIIADRPVDCFFTKYRFGLEVTGFSLAVLVVLGIPLSSQTRRKTLLASGLVFHFQLLHVRACSSCQASVLRARCGNMVTNEIQGGP